MFFWRVRLNCPLFKNCQLNRHPNVYQNIDFLRNANILKWIKESFALICDNTGVFLLFYCQCWTEINHYFISMIFFFNFLFFCENNLLNKNYTQIHKMDYMLLTLYIAHILARESCLYYRWYKNFEGKYLCTFGIHRPYIST